MVFNTLFPVFAMILMGRLLKLTGFTGQEFFKNADRLVYYIFFPCMLFWKIGGASADALPDPSLPFAALCAVMLVFSITTLFIAFTGVPDFQAGTFSQSCYRFNTYIGLAIVLNAQGEAGVVTFGILAGFLIPVINVLSISILIWFSGRNYSSRARFARLLKALLSNPLIVACISGIIFSRLGLFFPPAIDNFFRMISMVTLPLALLSIGSTFSFAAVRGNIALSVVSALFKMGMLPLAGLLFMIHFGVTGESFKTGLIFFCLPTSTAIYVLSSQMNSDTELAAASIVFSTMMSIFSLSMVLSIM
ncbi:Auxin Efflux Carrier [Desulfamplus magnetovallimortis]|uniref:Auxin Efflux Carrier n=1 Tax=Desulfamplus magnetovallimortis TaxID=1246637 RepID=A0A1W1H979_9BACT|nr:AEC family transporter [Desulfamplus magnetovallimortis]SLM28918.1 Auxin Efflux Carrier [Desulfamplus magnetovallimortis]